MSKAAAAKGAVVPPIPEPPPAPPEPADRTVDFTISIRATRDASQPNVNNRFYFQFLNELSPCQVCLTLFDLEFKGPDARAVWFIDSELCTGRAIQSRIGTMAVGQKHSTLPSTMYDLTVSPIAWIS